MPKVNLSGMTIEGLMDLRQQVGKILRKRRAEIEKQLERMDGVAAGASAVRARGSSLKGRKSRRNIVVRGKA